MPNHVLNILKFKKLKTEDIEFLVNTIAGSPKAEAIPVPVKEYIIDFNKIIPEPLTKDECPIKHIRTTDSCVEEDKTRPWFDWYTWHNEFWNTKWNAYDGYTIIGKTYVTFVFNTAWNTPYTILDKLALLNYDFEHRYADEALGTNCGKIIYSSSSPSEHKWQHWEEHDFKDPYRYAKNLWDRY